MTAAFAARYPRVWHVMEAEGARCEILYPAAELRRLARLPADTRNRDDFECLSLSDGTTAILRQQLMRDEQLRPTLTGVFLGRPDLWRDHINHHVFFWVSEDRRDRFVNACIRLRARGALGPGPVPVVLEIDTGTLLATHGESAFFSRINTGSIFRGGARTARDETTLRDVRDWNKEKAVELAIRGPVSLARVISPHPRRVSS